MTNGIFCQNRKAKKNLFSKDLNEYQLNNWLKFTLKKLSKNKRDKINYF